MSLLLPHSSSPLREMFDVADLVDWKKIPTFRQCLDLANNAFANKCVHSINCLCLRMNGEIWLITIGPKGGWSVKHNFGNPVGC